MVVTITMTTTRAHNHFEIRIGRMLPRGFSPTRTTLKCWESDGAQRPNAWR
jgi:hypothetical protein